VKNASFVGSLKATIMSKGYVAVLLSGVLLLFVGCRKTKIGAASPAISAIETEEGFAFFEGEEKVLFYQRTPKSLDGKYSRCNYIHPLYGRDGEILTEDFPEDHRHHRGIFWAWHQVLVGDKNMGDGWSLKDIAWDVYDAQITAFDSGATELRVEVFWKSPLWTDSEGRQKPFVKEKTTICVHPASGDIREIDFEIGLLALEDGVRIGGANNDKAYGGFSTRIRLPEDISFTSEGGEVVPMRTPIEAGPWLDFSGGLQEGGQVSGLAILCHRSLPGYPQLWILRRSGSMQNAVYPGREPILLSREEPLVLRYRLVVHRGDAQQIDLNKLQAQYNAEYH
jgi:hypothetical protein